ncbi:MAG: hypothetical protein EOL91_02610 [Actinobacteria bacterium]|nr:hypothetical protein [Actinomycetota bacterium]
MDQRSGLITTPSSFSFGIEVVPLVRGHLAAALEMLAHTSDAALEVCAAWAELDEAAQLPTMHDVPEPQDAATAIETARALLHDAMPTADTVARAMVYGRAVRHLDDALTTLAVVGGAG